MHGAGSDGKVRIIIPDDVTALKSDLADRVTDLGAAVAKCTAVNDPDYEPAQFDWRSIQFRVATFLDSEPGFTSTSAKQFTQGESLLAEIQAFSQRLVRMGCAGAPKASAPEAEPPLSLNVAKAADAAADVLKSGISSIGTALLFLGIIFILGKAK